MAARPDTGEIVKRALAYPYASPECSFVLEGSQATELPAREVQRDESFSQTTVSLPTDHRPLLAYGANASPQALARKLAALPEQPLFAARARLEDFDVVYSAHVSPYGAVPATLLPSPGTSVDVHVLYPSAEQLPVLAATEPNYELSRMREVVCRIEAVDGSATRAAPSTILASFDAFISRHGHLTLDGAPVALTAIPAHNRRLASMAEPEVLERVRSHLAPDLSLDQFIVACVARGGIAPLPSPFRETGSASE